MRALILLTSLTSCSWGIPRPADEGPIAIVIIERKPQPGSPKRPTHSRNSSNDRTSQHEADTEQVVGRLVVNVVDKRRSADPAGAADVHVVRY